MNSNICVVIPVHTAAPTNYELISFQQCFKVLGSHAIYVVAPENLDLGEYQKVATGFKEIRVAKKWLSSKLDYNKLKLSQYFYNFFSKYTFMLTHELDAFVFSDHLEHWCHKGYDYIGAPWFEGHDTPTENIVGVGNSGFSIRKISSVKRGLKRVHYIDPTKYGTFKQKRLNLRKFKGVISKSLNNVSRIRNIMRKENASIQNAAFLFEDRVITDLVAKNVKRFKIAPVEDAIKFSFEVNPELLYSINHNKLPMGCHAWWQYNLPFWKPFIESYGYKL